MLAFTDRSIRRARGPKNALDPRVPYGCFVEPERDPGGRMVDVATVLLTNRECPYTCLMCDLWVNTLDRPVPAGAIAAQVRHALKQLPPARVIKLYNAGSFFDPKAIPRADWPELVELFAAFERVIVEAHPALVGEGAAELAERLGGRLEVAMGLETAHPEVLARLNKRMTLEDFRAAAGRLTEAGIASRAFILLRPPWMSEAEGVHWALESLAFARACGVGCAVVIATRGGNGALEQLAAAGEFAPPSLTALEEVLDRALAAPGPMRVFVDLWDAAKIARCDACRDARLARLRAMNDAQELRAPVACGECPV